MLCLGLRAVAAPRPDEDFRRHYNQAMRLYEDRQFDAAIDEFQAAFAIKQLPRLLYNLGRAHFQLGHAQQALEVYRRYLALDPSPPPEVQAKVQDNMAQAQAMLDAAERMKAGAAPPGAAPPGAAAPPSAEQGVVVQQAPITPAPASARSGKAGPFMINARIGAAVPLAVRNQDGLMGATSLPTELAVGLEFGFALNAARSVYLLIPPQVQIEGVGGPVTATWIMLPLALQVDIPIRAAPGLYLYPRVSAGYAAGIFSTAENFHGGMAIPEFGVKYVVLRRVSLGFEPLSLPILFNSQAMVLFYRAMFHVGVNL